MKSIKNAKNGIDFHDGIDHIFSEMQEFLKTPIIIQGQEDIVKYFNTFVKYTNKIINFYYDNETESIEKEFSPQQKDENGYTSQIEGKYYEIMDFLMHQMYDHKEDNFERQISNHIADEEHPLTSKDIYVSYDMDSGTLDTIPGQENFDQIIKEFQQAINKTNNKVLWIVEKEKRAKDEMINRKKQQAIEAKNAKAIKDLLSNNKALSSNDNTDIIICEPTFATEEDFTSGYYSVKNIIHEIYAEKEEYFNNLFLGFDFKTGTFQSSKQKEKQYNKYYMGKKGEKRLQEIQQFDTTKNLPAIISEATSNILKIIQSNTTSILLTDEQKIDAHLKTSIAHYVGNDNDRATIKRIILERYKKYNPETEEEKNKIRWKVIGTYYDVRRHRSRKLDISLPLSTEIKLYLGNNIWGCRNDIDFDELRGSEVEEKILTLPDKRKETIDAKKARIDQQKKVIGEEIFGVGFDFETLKNSESFQWDLRFYGSVGRMYEPPYGMVLRSMFSGNTRVGEFLEKIKVLDKNYNAYLEETLKTYTFIEDIEKIKNIEKEIKEKFDSNFVLDSEKLGDILHGVIKHILNNRFLNRDKNGVNNMEKGITDMTKRISLFGVMHNHDNGFVIQAYEKALHTINQMYQLKIFMKIVKDLELPITYDKEKMREILQNGHDELQYDVGNFGIRQINDIEDIKKIAGELSIKLDLPPVPPLEAYYIHRLRTPERILIKQMKENSFDRHEGTIGYEKGNLAAPRSLEELAQEVGMSLRREEVLNIDMREYKNIPQERRFDIDQTVPVAVHFPKVRTILSGSRDEKGVMQGHYVFLYNPKTKLYSLLFDDSFMDSTLLIQKHKLFEDLILGGGFLVFDKNTTSVLVEDRIEKYNHEPRILSITALKNAIKDTLPGYRVFIGNDGVDKFESYF